MKLTTKGRFAVTAMLDLALHHTGDPITLAAISQRQGISQSYLEQLFGKLRRRKLVDSVRGPGGGYWLAKPAGEITIAQIILAVDEPLSATRCGTDPMCGPGGMCLTHGLWARMTQHLLDFLSGITLGELAEDTRRNSTEVSVPISQIGHGFPVQAAPIGLRE